MEFRVLQAITKVLLVYLLFGAFLVMERVDILEKSVNIFILCDPIIHGVFIGGRVNPPVNSLISYVPSNIVCSIK